MHERNTVFGHGFVPFGGEQNTGFGHGFVPFGGKQNTSFVKFGGEHNTIFIHDNIWWINLTNSLQHSTQTRNNGRV